VWLQATCGSASWLKKNQTPECRALEPSRTGAHPDMAGIDEHISQKALEEIYLPHFKATVLRAHAGAVMWACNEINGGFNCNSASLLGDLREWVSMERLARTLVRAKFIAVIGADASADAVVMETGSPNVHVGTLSVPVDAIRARAGCEGACRVKVYDEARGAWMLFAGRYKLMVGASSRDIRLQRQWVVP
jgi:hypothetical protein